MDRRQFLEQAAAASLGTTAWSQGRARGAEPEASVGRGDAGGLVLYNGIRLPSPWPPRQLAPLPAREGDLPRVPPPTPSYLTSPPALIPIDVGRQLFVDDFLIAETTLKRTFHRARYHPACPLLRPDQGWEGSVAMPFSDGVWFDPEDRLFKMWYYGGQSPKGVCYATSIDGIRWDKPPLDAKDRRGGTNLVYAGTRDSVTVWLDQEDADPLRRYKMFRPGKGGSEEEGKWGYYHYASPDGIRWQESGYRTGSCGDRSTAFWNPFRKVWVYSLRDATWRGGKGMPRHRLYWESRGWAAGPTWDVKGDGPLPNLWAYADALDLPDPDLPLRTELYNLDAVAYESVLLGLFTIWRGDPEKEIPEGRPKRNSVSLGFSRDGFHWSRPDRRPFYGYSDRKDAWNYGNVQSAGGGCLVVGDELYFYCSGRSGHENSTGLAVLRRDGFASMDADAHGGSLTTPPVWFTGKHLFVNAVAVGGTLTAEVLDEGGRVIAPFARSNCVPVRADGTRLAVTWRGAEDLSAVSGRPARFRFHLEAGELYAFWTSPSSSGVSNGYVTAGGPGFSGPVDVG